MREPVASKFFTKKSVLKILNSNTGKKCFRRNGSKGGENRYCLCLVKKTVCHFYHLIDMCVVNLWLLFRKTHDSPMKQATFKEEGT